MLVLRHGVNYVMYQFSSKLLLSDRRNRLGDDIIEACECLKAWKREGFLISSEILAVETMLLDLEEVSEN